MFLPDNVLPDTVITYIFHVGLSRFRGCHFDFLYLAYFVYFVIRQFCYNLFTLNLIYADSKFEVKFVPAGQNFELDILAPFTNDRLAVKCYSTYDCGLH